MYRFRASTEPIWDTFRPTITPPPSLYAPSTWEAPSVANPEEPLSTWSGDSPGGFSQETFTQLYYFFLTYTIAFSVLTPQERVPFLSLMMIR